MDIVSVPSSFLLTVSHAAFRVSYLKRVFKDLFDRQNCEDDGVFDWDLMKRQQEAAGQPAVIPTAIEMQQADQGDVPREEDNNAINNSRPTGALLADDGNRDNRPSGSGLVAQTSNVEENTEAKEGHGKRSIISSIRHSLFGSRSGQRPDTSAAQAGGASGGGGSLPGQSPGTPQQSFNSKRGA